MPGPKRSDAPAKGFVVQPGRWVVERTFGWLMQARRLVRDFETNPASSPALILALASRIMLRSLAREFLRKSLSGLPADQNQ